MISPEERERNRQGMIYELKTALVDPSPTAYEEQRALIIYKYGYDFFRDLQNEAFKQMFGAIKHETMES